MTTKHFIRQKINQRYGQFAEKPRYQTGMLGNVAGVVRASRNHYVYVRLRNGEVVEAYNDRVPSTAGRPVVLRWASGRWMIESTWQVFDEPIWDGVGEHSESHDLYGTDPLYVRAGQFLPGLVIPKPGELAIIVCNPLTELYENIDLSEYIPENGAIWALISFDLDDGSIGVTTGGTADSYGELLVSEIPSSADISLAALKLYAGQLEIVRSKIVCDIVDLRWLQSGNGGGSISLPANRLVATDDDGQPADNAPIWSEDGLATWSEEEYTWPGLNLMGFALAGESLTPGAVFIRANSTATSASLINFTKFGGSLASPSAILSGWRLGSFQFGGHYGDGIDFTKARISAEATENWSDPNRGTKIKIEATPNETNAIETVAEFSGDEITLHKLGYGVTPDEDADGTELATTEWVRDQGGGFSKSDYWENNASAGRLWGGIITDAGSGNIDIAAGAGLIKTGGSSIDGNTGIPTSLNEGQGSETQLVEWDAIEDFPLAGVGYNLVFWDASEGEFAVALKENFYSVFNFVTDFTIGRVYYDGTTAISRLCGMNRWNFERRVQMFGEERFPVERASGLMLSGTGTRNIAITAGVLWAELVNRFSVSAFDSSGAGRFTYWYRDGSGGWTAQTSQSQINNTQYDDGDGTLGTLTANRYGVHWVYVVHDSGVHVVFGQGDYTLANALASTPPSTLPGLLGAYASFAGRIIIQKSAAAFYQIDSPFTTTLGTGGGVSNHNDLSGLQGGAASEYYHLTSAQQGVVEDIAALTPTENYSLVWSLSGWTTAKRVEEAPDDGNVYGRRNTVWTNLRTIFDALYVALTGNQTVAGIKTFSSFPVTPSAAPTANYEVANKKYVDDSTSGVGIPEAPEDGYIYGRKDADWEAVDGIGFDSFQTEEGLTYTRTSGGSYTYIQQRIVLYRPIKLNAIKWDIRGTGTYTLSLRKADATTEIESIAVSCPGTSRVTFSLAADRIMAPGSYVLRMTAPSSVQWYNADTGDLDMYYDGWGIIQREISGGTAFAYRSPIVLVFYNSSQGNVTNTVLDNVRYLLPFSSYNTLGSPMSSSPLYPYAATLPGFTIYPKRWSQGVFIGATNNASNYWTIELIASVSGSDSTIATLNTSALGASAAAVLVTTTFSPTSLTQASNIRLAIKVTKVGSPSNLSAHGPALEYTLA